MNIISKALIKAKINQLNRISNSKFHYWIKGRTLYCDNTKIQSFKKSEIENIIDNLMVQEK